MAAGTKPTENQQPCGVEDDQRGSSLQPPWIRLLLLALAVGVLLAVVYLSPLRHYLGHMQEASERIRSFGPLAPLVLMLSVAVLVAVGFPRLLFCFIAGMALGFWPGLFWAQVGTLLGNYASFIVVRAVGRDRAERVLVKRPNLRRLIKERRVPGVVIARQLPFPGWLINLACALLPIRHVDFIVGTMVGQLPQAIPCTLIGAGVLQPSLKKGIGVIGLAVGASILAWFRLRYVLRRNGTVKTF